MKKIHFSICWGHIIFIFAFYMYSITREDAAVKLNLSTRSIDRYIKSGKLRSQKDGKIVYIHKEDVENFWWATHQQEVIVPSQKTSHLKETSLSQTPEYSKQIWVIFDTLRQEIKIKDDEIKHLSLQLGKMEEITKNSISLIEFKKTQFLLEESKNSLHQELDTLNQELTHHKASLKEEKKLNIILICITIFLFLAVILVWLVKI